MTMARLALLASACLLPVSVQAQDDTTLLPPVDIDSTTSPAALSSSTLSREELRHRQNQSSDTAGLLSRLPGVSINGGGGFSSMPAIRGLSEQRLSILVDGAPIDAACPNDMNSPLSYTDPQTIQSIRVITGVAPVSMGGDSIGGTIAIDGPAPRFATGSTMLLTGEASAFYRSNGDGFGGAVTLTAASEHLSATYTGSFTQSDQYKGGDNRGLVRSTEYKKTDHALALAYQGDAGLFELKGGYHFSPYEGFPNQYMDMTSNKSWYLNGHYQGAFDWGTVDMRAHYRDTDHRMNFLEDKGGNTGRSMPMNTEVHSYGGSLKVDLPLSARDTVRVGGDYHHQWLNDYWPPVAGSMMMGPDTFINVNGATRDRVAGFAEWEARWTDRLSTTAGVRYDRVVMDTGNVAPYSTTSMMSMADAMAATAFNAASHKRTDNDWSASLLASYAPSDLVSLELGYAHKARSPNIYERYTWGTGSMASRMIGWFGDGNGYVGNLDLKPERADTVSAAIELHGGGADGWFLRLAPYYTHVNDYIDVSPTPLQSLGNGFVQLRFDNVDAEFYGIDLSGAVPLRRGSDKDSTRLTGSLSYVRGRNLSDDGSLYHQMPLNARLGIAHLQNGVEAGADIQWVAEKNRVDITRNEPKTDDYALLNLHAAYNWSAFRISLDIENLFDTGYDLPLGGMSLGDYYATGTLRPVPGRGRSFNIGLSARF
ncbi:MAG: TonB-dependent receptor [Sphingomonadales bacterium]|nr:MAG: TonB-dependent receptor [Sphingomonadales bacterium]